MSGHLGKGVELTLSFYMTSDSTGLNAKVNVTTKVVPEHLDGLTSHDMCRSAELQAVAQDWRPMTVAEIADYKNQEQEDA